MNNQFSNLIDTLKAHLKENKITYKELATRLKCSESSLKKMFSGKDCSVMKLINICKQVNLEFSDLVAISKNKNIEDIRFMKREVEEFFIKNMKHFNYFILLYLYRMTPTQIKEKYNINDKLTFKILKKLDELKLIELLPYNNVKVRKFGLETWTGEGPLMKKLRKEWAINVLNNSLASNKQTHKNELRHYQLTPFKLTVSEANKFIKDSKKLYDEYFIKSNSRYDSKNENLVILNSLLCFSPELLVDEEILKM